MWEQIKGENLSSEIDWVPYVFHPAQGGDIKTIDGTKVQKKIFDSYVDYYQYTTKDNNFTYEDRVRPEIQFLTERYYRLPDEDMEVPKLCTYFLDIEVYQTKGFPKASEAKDKVVSIAIYNTYKNRTTVFGLKPYDGKYRDEKDFNYVHCKDEEKLLRMFFIFIDRYSCDVISGWNVLDFDLMYLINRTKKLFGEDTNIYKTLSPVRNVRLWENDKKEIKLDIAGVTILDYMHLYKWYSPDKRERYSLDFISKHELEKGKIDYSEYKNLNELYEKDYNKFIEYNIMDTYRPSQLEDKLGYIKLVQALSLLCRVPMKYYQVQTQLIEGLLLTHMRRNNLCAPHFHGGVQETFEAAYVKEPQSGMHEWICDFDIASSYPSHIITLNMSPETYYGRILEITEDQMVFYTKDRNYPPFTLSKGDRRIRIEGVNLLAFNSALEKRLFSIAPCGSVFYTKPVGVLSAIEKYVFTKRKEVKDKRDRTKMSLSELRGENLDKAKERAGQFDSIQNALKTMLNAAFGITAVPYSRYFNMNISEAITSCGRMTIRSGERFINDFFQQGKYAHNEAIINTMNMINITEFPKIIEDMVAYGDSITGDTPIPIRYNGLVDIIPIEDLYKFDVDGRHIIENIDIMSDNGWTPIKYIYRHKTNKNIYSVNAYGGRIDCTEDHSLVVDNKKVKPLETNKVEFVEWNLPKDNNMNLNEAWLLGMFCAEGSMSKKIFKNRNTGKRKKTISHKADYSIKYSNKNIKLLNVIKDKLLRLNIKSRIYNVNKQRDCYPLNILKPKSNYDFFIRCFTKKMDKKIPIEILNSNKDVKMSFYQGYYEGDGYNKKKEKDECFCSIDKTLMSGLVQILKNDNKNLTISTRSDKKNVTNCRININSHDKKIKSKNLIKKIIKQPTNIYVYDIETENHHFVGGIGNILLHNTDSLYVKVGHLMKFIGKEKWNVLDDEKKIHYIRRITHTIEEYINDRCYKEVQKGFYNSAVTDFKIMFKQEIIAKTALFVKKKKYSMWHVNEEGVSVNKIKTKGLEIIRSETPEAVRPKLVDLMEMILKGSPDSEISSKIAKYKKELRNCLPEEICMNIGTKGISKYIKGNDILKGAPWHVKGVRNYRFLLKHLGLEDKYEDIEEGNKTKVIYLKSNKFGLDEMSFLIWPKEFDNIVQIDYNKQIQNNFIKKIEILLDPMNKLSLLDESGVAVNLFF